jgi:hypothetical protein
MPTHHPAPIVLVALAALAGAAPARGADPLPVREVTVFKDGHAFVLREGPLSADAGGKIVLSDLPQPLLGTFWPYATDGAVLRSAVAANERIVSERTALDLRELVEANRGASVLVTDMTNEKYTGTLIGIPRRSAGELESLRQPTGTPALDEAGSLLVIETDSGTRVLPLEQVRNFEVRGSLGTKYQQDELRGRLTLRVEGGGADSRVGVAYVQKGLRWIPSYKVDVGENGKARFELEATLVNDLLDLEHAVVHLVVGVPRFEAQGMLDPLALQGAGALVAAQTAAQDRFSNFLSNALMTQVAGGYSADPGVPAEAPSFQGASANEDLYVYTLRDVTLARGERMVLPITKFELEYRDVYTLDLPVAPPLEFQSRFDGSRIERLAELAEQQKVQHVLRLNNSSGAPLTTAPALVLSGGRVVGQSILTYVPAGAETDLVMTTALDVCVEKLERETGRSEASVRWNNREYRRIDMSGAYELSNKKREAVELEVRCTVLGLADTVGDGGQFEQLSSAEWWSDARRPEWWSWWSWPYWWYHWNGVARFEWKLKLIPGAQATLGATWHYYWE